MNKIDEVENSKKNDDGKRNEDFRSDDGFDKADGFKKTNYFRRTEDLKRSNGNFKKNDDPEKNCDDQGSMSDPYLLLGYSGMDEIYWFGVLFGEMSGIDELSWIEEISWFSEMPWLGELPRYKWNPEKDGLSSGVGELNLNKFNTQNAHAELLVDPVYHGWMKALRLTGYMQGWRTKYCHNRHLIQDDN